MDMSQYLEVFIDESKEHLQTCNEQLLELEKNPQDLAIVNEIFRSAHTLKGMSATMGYEDLANLTHKMENVLDGIRNEKINVTTEILDVVFQAVDDLEAMVVSISNGGDGKRNVSEVVNMLMQIEKGESPTASPAKDEAAAYAAIERESGRIKNTYDEFELTVLQQSREQGFESYEVTVQIREDCLLKAVRVFMVFEVLEKAGEVIKTSPPVEKLEEEQFDREFMVTLITRESPEDIQLKVMKVSEVESVDCRMINPDLQESKAEAGRAEAAAETQTASPQTEISSVTKAAAPQTAKKENQSAKLTSSSNKTIRVNIERLDSLMNLFEELVIDRGRLEQISREVNNQELNETVERMSRISGDLQSIILNMRMVPVDTVFNRFPKMVRQLARDLKKNIHLEIIGAETELDRTVIDEIGDPLVHLLRNALDHGIEMPLVRKDKGKSEEGKVTLKAYHSGNYVFIEIEDDGAGMNREKILRKAVEKGIVSEQASEAMTDKQVYNLIFASGFSTADQISDISGRGVGLDVVRNTIESLGGAVSIDSREGKGSIFSIQLPLTLSIISVMLIEIQKEKYAIPLSSIIETAIIRKSDVLNAHSQKVIDFRGRVVPLVFLKEVFDVPEVLEDDEFYSLVIVRKGDKMAGLVVDRFIGQQEIVLKALGSYLHSAFAISGATILGDGQVALIIDCNALIK
ncbi:two-component system chemotaxis sensor kinase CheA [Peribacillus deserti]|uniref:Chemotaxis protein CheA n=1 Tax=Peribacillus deserti TaxID=673318 RepID=A0ABS2QGG3_9BACI|nr:chemotaxis protein CheA [Peribacillus deserti]MBM7692244.1 two-component system chemotaxis sensor kinase CheA [Peribacillus deserti]